MPDRPTAEPQPAGTDPGEAPVRVEADANGDTAGPGVEAGGPKPVGCWRRRRWSGW
nr:hypothetical protein [Micromonospora endophytica]